MEQKLGLSENSKEFLEDKFDKVYSEWLKSFWAYLGKESKRFFEKEVDQFTNPMGHRVRETFEGILRELFGEFEPEKVLYFLEKFIQLRALQENEPSKAIYPFVLLKSLIREKLGEDFIERFGVSEYLKLEDRINFLIIRACDFYFKYKERIWALKYEEWKRNRFLLLKRAGMLFDPVEGMPNQEEIGDIFENKKTH